MCRGRRARILLHLHIQLEGTVLRGSWDPYRVKTKTVTRCHAGETKRFVGWALGTVPCQSSGTGLDAPAGRKGGGSVGMWNLS
jgi:hypothetical protein